MSVAGLRKQLNKASQYMSERVGGAEGTKLDEDFKELEKKADVTSKAVVELMSKTSEYLQPNASALSTISSVSKIRGIANAPDYTQQERVLGDCMVKYGSDMGTDSHFGAALVEVGESMRMLAETKDSLDTNVKQNFIDPLHSFADKDIKDLQRELKKLEGRRLDYDYKKKRQGKIPDEEIRQAMEKFHDSIDRASRSMNHMLESDVEHVSQLSSLVTHLLEYHRQSSDILENLLGNLQVKINQANSQPRQQYTPKQRPSFDYGDAAPSNGSDSSYPTSPPAYSNAKPSCQALYDFEPENEGELGFKEGDVITLTSQIDENWMEGTLRGQTGFFPISFVNITVPLSN